MIFTAWLNLSLDPKKGDSGYKTQKKYILEETQFNYHQYICLWTLIIPLPVQETFIEKDIFLFAKFCRGVTLLNKLRYLEEMKNNEFFINISPSTFAVPYTGNFVIKMVNKWTDFLWLFNQTTYFFVHCGLHCWGFLQPYMLSH